MTIKREQRQKKREATCVGTTYQAVRATHRAIDAHTPSPQHRPRPPFNSVWNSSASLSFCLNVYTPYLPLFVVFRFSSPRQHWDKDVCLNFTDRCLSFLKDNVDEGPRYSMKFLEPFDQVTLEQIASPTTPSAAGAGGGSVYGER